MDKVDQTSADEYKKQERKKLKKLKKENPMISKQDYLKVLGDPAISKFHPLKHFGAISEKMDKLLKDYIKTDSMQRQIED